MWRESEGEHLLCEEPLPDIEHYAKSMDEEPKRGSVFVLSMSHTFRCSIVLQSCMLKGVHSVFLGIISDLELSENSGHM